TTGADAVRLAKEHQPDLCLIDIRLPGDMDGVEAVRLIRSHIDTAIVYLTAYDDDGAVQRAKRTQPHGFLLKPCAERDLRTTIDVALYKKRLEEFAPERERWFASADDAVNAVDAQGILTYVNPVAARLAATPGEAEGRRLDQAFRVVGATTGDELHIAGPAGEV